MCVSTTIVSTCLPAYKKFQSPPQQDKAKAPKNCMQVEEGNLSRVPKRSHLSLMLHTWSSKDKQMLCRGGGVLPVLRFFVSAQHTQLFIGFHLTSFLCMRGTLDILWH
jgi:hypothetical protein